MAQDIITIGASAGGLDPLRRVVADLPRNLPAAVFVVQHIGPRPSQLAELLAAAGPLPAAWAHDGEAIRAGRIYVAPPDHHLLVGPARMRLSRGPRENRTRPAVDPLFRSAAQALGPRVIGVVLSGGLNDGTAGLAEIKRCGGTAIIQEPAEALFPSMPLSAQRHVMIDHCLAAGRIGTLLTELAGQSRPRRMSTIRRLAKDPERDMVGGFDLTPPAALTCPACGGALKETRKDSLPYFTCHIGHRYAAGDFDEAQFQEMERALEVALRTLHERTDLCRRMARSEREAGRHNAADRWDAAQAEAQARTEVIRRFLEQEWQRPDPNANEDTG